MLVRAVWCVAIVFFISACTVAPGAHLGAVGSPVASESPRLAEVIRQLEGMSALQRSVDDVMIDLSEKATDESAAMRKSVLASSAALRNDVDEALGAVLDLQTIPGGDAEFYAAIDVDSQLQNAAVHMVELSGQLDVLSDDAQLANVDLQNILQKQQQTLQMMSNISKMLYDTATSIIRKYGG